MSQFYFNKGRKQGDIVWKIRVENFIVETFGKSSVVYENFKKNEHFRLKGNDHDQFGGSHQTILGTLSAAIDLSKNESTVKDISNNKVFIVHGHDEKMKNQLEIFLNEIGLEPVVLHREADEGLTVIEKFEKHSDVGYAFILLTPDDIAYPVNFEDKKEKRARQNVVFEFGYFVSKLGRNRVCCLYKRGVTIPTDIAGLLYKDIEENVEEKAFSILKDIKAAGYKINY